MRNQGVGLNGGPPSANQAAANGILLSKDDLFQKNKTFNYPKESSTTRVDHFGAINQAEQRR